MILDAQLQFSDAQAVTAAAGSTNTIDLGAVRDIGTGEDLYIVVSVQTTLTDGGSNTGTTVALEGDSTTTFTPDGTQDLFSFDQAAAAGTVKIAKLDPGAAPLQYQYIRLKYTPSGANLTGGAFDAFLTNNIERYVKYADGFTIS
jgi:hypothetical protein